MVDGSKSKRSYPPPPPRRKSGSSRPRSAEKSRRSNGSISRVEQQVHGGRKNGRSRSRPRDHHDRSSRSRSKSRPREKARSRSKSIPKQQSNKSRTPLSSTKSTSGQSNSGRSQKSRSSSKSVKRKEKYATTAKKAIPANVLIISTSSLDLETSNNSNMISSQFQLPNSSSRSSGVCTAAFLQVLHKSHNDTPYIDLIRRMRGVLEDKGNFPQLMSSFMMNIHQQPFVITPHDFNKNNTKRAILIGINYTGHSNQLKGCHSDVHNINKYLTEVERFRKEHVTILVDDGAHKSPTKAAIMNAFKRVVKESKDGDVVFCHYSGRSGRLLEEGCGRNGRGDGYETLIPVDYQKKGQIRDRDLLKTLIHPLKENVTMTFLIDCCHNGSVIDLPYRFLTTDGANDGEHDNNEEMEMNDMVNFKDELWSGLGLALGASAVVATAATPPPEMMILGGGPNAIHEYSDTGCCTIS